MQQSIGLQALESMYRFALGSIAGGKDHMRTLM